MGALFTRATAVIFPPSHIPSLSYSLVFPTQFPFPIVRHTLFQVADTILRTGIIPGSVKGIREE